MPGRCLTNLRISSAMVIAANPYSEWTGDNSAISAIMRKRKQESPMSPGTDTRRIRRLEAELGSLSSGNDKAVQDLEKAVAELTLRVANLEAQASSPR
jgi:hypothetical protein